VDGSVAALDAVNGVKDRALDDGRIAGQDELQGIVCNRGLEQNLVPVGDLVGVNGCGDAEGDNSKSEQQKATYARLHGILLCL
jgi:hypothetical protein